MKNLARIMICLVWTGVLAAAALPAGEEPALSPTTAVTQIRQTIRQLRLVILLLNSIETARKIRANNSAMKAV